LVITLASLSVAIPIFKNSLPLTLNSFFYAAILISNHDLIKSKHKVLVVLLNLIHCPLPVLISIWFGAILYTTSYFQEYYLQFGLLLNSVLTILILNLSLRFQNLKMAFIGSIIVAFASPIFAKSVTWLIPNTNSDSISLEAFWFSWQILMGILLAFSLRHSTLHQKEKLN
jgi:hypothetical protein